MLVLLLTITNLTSVGVILYHRFAWSREAPYYRSGIPKKGIEKSLSLSEQQNRKIKQLRRNFFKNIKPVRESMKQLQKELVTEMKKTQLDTARVDSIMGQIAQYQMQIQQKAVYSMFNEKNHLSAEQQENFLSMFEDHVCRRSGLMFGNSRKMYSPNMKYHNRHNKQERRRELIHGGNEK